ncbi:MAG: type IV pilus assembly protein PilM, partial [Hyphomicrobiaceae bacterium]|nr:type IV pilus assembly protein PilM [Hyphomicrobiaceae bacterium]
MPAGKSVWGIDIGQCALKAIKLRQVGDRIEAVGFDVIEHAKILSQPDADRYQLVRNALDKFVSRNEIDGDKIVISVPGHTSFARFIKLPPVESKRIPEIVDYEAAQQIPFNIDDVEWAWQRIPTRDTSEVEVGIFAIKKDIIDDLLENFKEAGISVDVVQMAPLALYNFLETDQHVGTGTTILVDIGAENTDLIVADGHRIWLRNIHIGGNNFTEALVKSFKLTFAKAENLKRTAANSKYARQIFQAMRPVFSDLVAEVQRSIGFYTSLHRDARIERIVGLGNAFRLPGLQKFLQQNLQVEVEKVEAFGTLGSSQVTSAPAFRDNLLS